MGRKSKFDNWALMDWIYGREDLTAMEKHIALATFYHRNRRTGDCHPSVELIAKRAGLNKNTILAYVPRLESKNICTVDRKPGRGGNWYYALFDDERAEPFRGSSREKLVLKYPQVVEEKDSAKNGATQPTEKEIKMPEPTKVDPALVDLVIEIRERGITSSSDLREDLIEVAQKMLDDGWKFPFITRKFNEAKIPRLRGGDKPWTDPDVRQMVNPPTKKLAPAVEDSMPIVEEGRASLDRTTKFRASARELWEIIGDDAFQSILSRHNFTALADVEKVSDMEKILQDCGRALKGLAPAEELPEIPGGPYDNHGERIRGFIRIAGEFRTRLGEDTFNSVLNDCGYEEVKKVRKRVDMRRIFQELERAEMVDSEGPF